MILPEGMQLPCGLRVMVFAPHPDDESLGAGGLLQLIAASRGTSRVVFVTSGDGFVEGARRYFGRPLLVPDDFIDYGRLRCREALDAMKSLGIGRVGIDFLGFPDTGIEALWSAHRTEHPYVSPHTCMDHPPYPDCLNRECRYTGSSLNRMISDVITGFSPHWVVLPDPLDRHPDHRGTALFVLHSLSRLAGSGMLQVENMRVLTYLIHSPSQPPVLPGTATAASGDGGSAGAVDTPLLASVPLSFSLDEKEQKTKKQAVQCYASQQFLLFPLLSRFVSSRESFSQLHPALVTDKNCSWNRLSVKG